MKLLGLYWVSVVEYQEDDYIPPSDGALDISPGQDLLRLATGWGGERVGKHKYWQQFPIWRGNSSFLVDLSQFPAIWSFYSGSISYYDEHIPNHITRLKRIHATYFRDKKPLCSSCLIL